tara:strand:- start:1526 stop:2563 length:1038 start_codon:yes stop_codon:yes gene_type:complete
MFLDMNKLNYKLSMKIAFFSTVIFVNIILLFTYFFNKTNYDFFISYIFMFIVLFLIIYFICNLYLNPLNKITTLLKDVPNTKALDSINLNNDDWSELEFNLNNIINKVNLDIRTIEDLGGARTQFLANVSHDLKTPIFTIKGYIETLLDGGINDEKVNKKFLKKIQSQISRIETIFTDLIEIARIESGELKMNFNWFNFNDLIGWIKDSFEDSAIKKGLNLSLPNSVNYEVYVDKNRIQTVLSNLFSNAIAYSNSGTIRLSVKVEENNLIIKIIDNGIGIAEKNQNRIFERFYREDPNRFNDSGSSGLGLAIVKHILDAHQSKYELNSQKNIGTTFSFSINYRRI